MKLTKILAAGAAAASFAIAASASAQEGEKIEPKFSADDAGKCMVTYGWIVQNLRPGPDETVRNAQAFMAQNQMGAMIWQWEFAVAMQDATDEQYEAKVNSVIESLDAEMPQAEGEEAGDAVIESILERSQNCGTQLAEAYPDGRHPVLMQLAAARQQQQMQQQQQQPAEGMAPVGE